MPGYELTALAEEDLSAIARYTVNTWGIHYELSAKRFQGIAQGNIAPRVFQKNRSDLLFTHCEYHHIFCWQPKDRKSQLFWQFCMSGWISCKDLKGGCCDLRHSQVDMTWQ